jgi:hypothetical protein
MLFHCLFWGRYPVTGLDATLLPPKGYSFKTAYRCIAITFLKGCAYDVCDRSHLSSSWLGSHGHYSLTAPSAPSLRPLVLSSSKIRCHSIQVYHHHPSLPIGEGKVLRVVNAPTAMALNLLLVVSFFVSEGAGPSTMSSHPFSAA